METESKKKILKRDAAEDNDSSLTKEKKKSKRKRIHAESINENIESSDKKDFKLKEKKKGERENSEINNNDSMMDSQQKKDKKKKKKKAQDSELKDEVLENVGTEKDNNDKSNSQQKKDKKKKKKKGEDSEIKVEMLENVGTKIHVDINDKSDSQQKKDKKKKRKSTETEVDKENHEAMTEPSVKKQKLSVNVKEGETEKIATGDKKKDKKKKKKKKNTSKKEVKQKSEDLEEKIKKCSSYLQQWKTNREAWKFVKLHQTWLLQNMYDENKLPDEDFDILLEYIEPMKGNSRETTVKKAEAMIEVPNLSSKQEERAKHVIQVLV